MRFALPGGRIGVYTGLLKVAKNQDQLAAVSHEVSHVLAQHSNERLSQSQVANIGMAAADAFEKQHDKGPGDGGIRHGRTIRSVNAIQSST